MAENNFRALQSANKGKTYFLLASMGLLTWLVTYAAMTYFGVGTASTMVPMAVGFALFGVWGSYYGSDKLVLTMTGAKLITREDAPELFNVIEEVVIASGLPMPKVAIVEDSAPNAFATGRDPDHALIAFTTRILDVMDRDELQGVIAHELAHVANRDTLVSAVAATTAGAIAILSDFLMRMMFFGGGRDREGRGDRQDRGKRWHQQAVEHVRSVWRRFGRGTGGADLRGDSLPLCPTTRPRTPRCPRLPAIRDGGRRSARRF